MTEGGRDSNSVVGLDQCPNHSSRMHVQLIEHHKCPHCPRLFATVQGLGSHQRTHMEINLQQPAIQEGRSAVIAPPTSATAPKSITNQEALGHTQIFQSKEIQEAGQQLEVAMEDQNAVLPLFFVPRVTKGGLDWSWEGRSYAAPSNLQLKKLDPDTACPETHESEVRCPRLVDFMNIPKHGEEMINS